MEPGWDHPVVIESEMNPSTPRSRVEGPEFGFTYQRVASQWRMLRERGIPMVYGVYEHPWYISIWGQGALDDTGILRRAIELGGHIKTGLAR